MLYHFGSRQELLNATIHYLARRRIEMFEQEMAEAARLLGNDRVAVRLAMIDIVWEQVRSPEFIAFQELACAARTDPELAAVVEPALALFDRMRASVTFRSLPQHMIRADDFQMVRDIVRFVTEGAAQQCAVTFDTERRLDAIRNFLRTLVASDAGAEFIRHVPPVPDPPEGQIQPDGPPDAQS
jgi:AcrR family transcriptional regulator